MHNRLLYFQRMIEKLGLQANPTLLYNLEEAYWKEVYKNLKLFPGAKKLLKILKNHNIKIGIITNMSLHLQIRKLKKLKIDKYIDFIVSSEEAGVEKPHKNIGLIALNKGHTFPNRTVIIDDNPNSGILLGEILNVGLKILYVPPYSKVKEYEGCDVIIKSYDELLSMLITEKIINKSCVVLDIFGVIIKDIYSFSDYLYENYVKDKSISREEFRTI